MVSMMDEQNLGFSLGATDYITKPVEPARLTSLLKRLCPSPDATVLIVDDDPAVRDRLGQILAAGGWRPAVAGNGEEALDRMDQVRPDLILLDLVMPRMDGFEFVSILKEDDLWRGVPVVVITSKDLTMEDRARLNGSVARVVMKDQVGPQTLVEQLRGILGRNLTAEA
jgi:CheY-like chemotaxis protein